MRQAKGIPTTSKVPSNNARLGIIDGQPSLGLPTGTSCPVAGGAPGHILDPAATTCVSDASAKALAMWPTSTTIDPGHPDRAIFAFAGVQIVPENFYTARVDHKISGNDSLFGVYLFDDTDFVQPDRFDNLSSIHIPGGNQSRSERATRSVPAWSIPHGLGLAALTCAT